MEYCSLDWDKVIQVVREAVIPLAGFFVAAMALYYNRLKLKIRLFAVAEQGPAKDFSWSVRITISNAGYTPFSIVKILDRNQNDLKLNDFKKPIKFDPGEIKDYTFPHEYATRKTYLFALDHRGKKHKINIIKLPPLLIPNSFQQFFTEPNYRTLGHLKRYLLTKIKYGHIKQQRN